MLEVVNAVTVVDPGSEIAQMFALVNNQTNNIADVQTNPPNPLNPLPGWLQNIYTVSGAPLPK
jgi:hypothetical protein